VFFQCPSSDQVRIFVRLITRRTLTSHLQVTYRSLTEVQIIANKRKLAGDSSRQRGLIFCTLLYVMHTFEQLSNLFAEKFKAQHFPSEPASLYSPNEYFLQLAGKRVRPALCLMGNELFDDINTDAWQVATAIELFHNFTLIHDDIMDKAPLRRGMPTVHEKFGESTALLAGDVMLVFAYDYLNRVNSSYLHRVIDVFNDMAKKVCEGQQLDMDFEKIPEVSFPEYLNMIELKTSVLIATSLKLGAILGGATTRNQDLLYDFGKKLGIAFQIQDDYLDAFGDPEKFGKQPGGDIKMNKKTFLLVHALQSCSPAQKRELIKLMKENGEDKAEKVIQLLRECKVDEWTLELKSKYFNDALDDLEEMAVLSRRKESLKQLAEFLVQREY
jgi:geranylgeranyl diphosphate synthase, type II